MATLAATNHFIHGIHFLLLAIFVLSRSSAESHRSNVLPSAQYKPWDLRQKQQRRLSIRPKRENIATFMQQLRGGESDQYRGYDSRTGGNYRDEYYGDERSSRQSSGYYDEYYDRPYDKGAKGRTEYDEYGRYSDFDDRGSSPLRSDNVQRTLNSLPSKLRNGDRRIGIPLLGLGMVFTMMGISLFFNKALMRLGNLMFIAGVPTTIGPKRTADYFLQPQKTRATACLFAGIFLVFVGWPICGIALEVFGILNLFGNMFPMFWAIFKNMPIVSSIMNSAGADSRSRPPPTYRERDHNYDSSRNPYNEDRQGYEGDYNDEAEQFY